MAVSADHPQTRDRGPASARPAAAPAAATPRRRPAGPARPVRAIAARACSTSVDLPIPGSPPSKVTDPGTSPPPSTRSSSATPVGTGVAAVAGDARSGPPAAATGPGRAGSRPTRRLGPRPDGSSPPRPASSTPRSGAAAGPAGGRPTRSRCSGGRFGSGPRRHPRTGCDGIRRVRPRWPPCRPVRGDRAGPGVRLAGAAAGAGAAPPKIAQTEQAEQERAQHAADRWRTVMIRPSFQVRVTAASSRSGPSRGVQCSVPSCCEAALVRTSGPARRAATEKVNTWSGF